MEAGSGRGLCRLEIRAKSRRALGQWEHHSSTAELAEHLWGNVGNRIQVADAGVAAVLGSGPSSRIHESANANARFWLRSWESVGRCEHCRRRPGVGL